MLGKAKQFIARTNSKSRRRDRRAKRPALSLESLERRELFSVNATLLSGGVLNVLGSDVGETIEVRRDGYATLVIDNGTPVAAFNSLGVNSVTIDARGGDDTVRVTKGGGVWTSDQNLNYLYNREVPATIRGGAGNDRLYGTGVADTIQGGSGVDRIYGNGGNDTLYGDTHTDYLYGGSGHDMLDGGSGNDYLYGEGDNDRVYGNTGADYLNGGSGNDRLDGGYDNDRIYGSTGNDYLYGYIGNDSLYGGSGDDYLSGHYGDDLLKGEAGNDRLYGSVGDDNLYGGGGTDYLNGGSDNDGLFGGSGQDTLDGGSGADRLLVWDAVFSDIAYHTVQNVAAEDAVVHFRDTYSSNPVGTTLQVNGRASSQTLTYGAGTWSESEIETIDAALEWLHDLTDNTRLLKTSTGATPVSFARYGSYVSRNATDGVNDVADRVANGFGPSVGAWNLGGGALAFTQHGINWGSAAVRETVAHEVGHNWDDESVLWGFWLDQSGWRLRPTATAVPGPGEALSGDGAWFYQVSSPFYRDYSKWNPYEDWATAWEAYYQREQGTLSADVASRMAVKLSFIDSLVDSLS